MQLSRKFNYKQVKNDKNEIILYGENKLDKLIFFGQPVPTWYDDMTLQSLVRSTCNINSTDWQTIYQVKVKTPIT